MPNNIQEINDGTNNLETGLLSLWKISSNEMRTIPLMRYSSVMQATVPTTKALIKFWGCNRPIKNNTAVIPIRFFLLIVFKCKENGISIFVSFEFSMNTKIKNRDLFKIKVKRLFEIEKTSKN